MSENNKVMDDFSDEDKVGSSMNFWDYKNNNQVIGVFMDFQKDGFGEHAVLEVNQQELHLPNLTALNSKLRRAKLGNKVKIVNLGEKKSEKTGRMYCDFEVFIKE